MSEDTIKINGKEVSQEELNDKQEEVKHQPDVDLVETAPNEFKQRIKG